MLIFYPGKLIRRIAICDRTLNLSAPAKVGLGQIVRRHSEICARDIQAAQHNLILQHQLPDQLGCGNLERLVADRDMPVSTYVPFRASASQKLVIFIS